MPSPSVSVCQVSDCGQSESCEVIPPCGFNLHFSYLAKFTSFQVISFQGWVHVTSRCCCCCWVASVVSDSVQPHRQQPTRLPSPWDSPGKNTGVGCHFLLQCMQVKSESELAQSCLTLSRLHGLQPIRLLRPWDFPAESTGAGCHCLLRPLDAAFYNSTLF